MMKPKNKSTKIKTKNKRIWIFVPVAVIGIVVVGLGLLAFILNAKNTDQQESNPNTDISQTLQGIITQVEQGKDGVQVELKTEYGLYSFTISVIQTEIVDRFEQIEVGTEIEVSGQVIAGMEPPLIVAKQVTVLGSSTQLTGETWVLTTYNDQQPIAGHQPILQFETEQVSGMTGCNHYGGTYQIQGDTIQFEDLYSTEMACTGPVGVMEEERIYLKLLGSADRFELTDSMLILFSGPHQIMTFEVKKDNPILSTPTMEQPALTPTAAVVEPTLTLTFESPAGFKEYRDAVAGVSIYIPVIWVVTGVIEGQFAIFQSYPEDKYIGGEGRDPEDTKCDLKIQPVGTSAGELIQQWDANELTTIVSDVGMTLHSGLVGRHLVLESMGRSVALVTEINNRAIVLNCFGNSETFEVIAITLSGFEVTASPIHESEAGFKQYQDTGTGVNLDMPGNWIVTGIIPGQRATLQSYPENKYVGGEALNPGDTKCDLFIRDDVNVDEFIKQMKSNEVITLISEKEISLNSGQTATRIDMDSMGRSTVFIAEINSHVILLTCFGDVTLIDEIAATLRVSE